MSAIERGDLSSTELRLGVSRVVLVDGERLASLMIHYGVGVRAKRTVQIVEIDEDFVE